MQILIHISVVITYEKLCFPGNAFFINTFLMRCLMWNGLPTSLNQFDGRLWLMETGHSWKALYDDLSFLSRTVLIWWHPSLLRVTPAAVPKRGFSKLDLEQSNRDTKSSGSTCGALSFIHLMGCSYLNINAINTW